MGAETWIAIIAVTTSVFSVGASIYFGWCSRDHNRRSVTPLPYIIPSDYEDSISVRLWNNGTGPLVLQRVTARNKETNAEGHLVNLMPETPETVFFRDFVCVQRGRPIRPGDKLNLIDIDIDITNPTAVQYRDILRATLKHIVIVVEYSDIYNSSFEPHRRELTWFQREQV